jgi:hypothetical protein
MKLVVNRETAGLATEMIAIFGEQAGAEAAARADRSRDLGNAVNYCNWRQAERLIVLLSTNRAQDTLH